jgi:hypothetical protein
MCCMQWARANGCPWDQEALLQKYSRPKYYDWNYEWPPNQAVREWVAAQPA